jgi:hypothetical protein
MKVYLVGNGHRKNIESIFKTLQFYKIPYHHSMNLNNLDDSYTLAICFTDFFPPAAFPSSCKVIYGPHFFVFPEDKNHPLYKHTYDSSRFFFNVLSDWNEKVHQEFGLCHIPLIKAFFGIDTSTITPVSNDVEKSHVMVYYKDSFHEKINHVETYLQSISQPYYRIVYGHYNDADFKQKMESCKFIIWIGRHESQGFAFQESLARNIPILLWDVESMYEEYVNNKRIYEPYAKNGYKLLATCAPFWSDECGIRFLQKEDFVPAYSRMCEIYQTFTPRSFIEKTASIPIAWKNLLLSIGCDN